MLAERERRWDAQKYVESGDLGEPELQLAEDLGGMRTLRIVLQLGEHKALVLSVVLGPGAERPDPRILPDNFHGLAHEIGHFVCRSVFGSFGAALGEAGVDDR